MQPLPLWLTSHLSVMRVAVKFCGLTRAADVARAAELGAEYVGVIFAGGPRLRTLTEAAEILRGAGDARCVGVFGTPGADELHRYVQSIPLRIAQLHGDSTARAVSAARLAGAQEVWAVVPVTGGQLAPGAEELFQCADAVVLDTRASTGLGGTGRSFDWELVAQALVGLRGPLRARGGRLVVAGGLTPENVAQAIRYLEPDVVDVSSGVELAPGIKDPILMSRFVEAAWSA